MLTLTKLNQLNTPLAAVGKSLGDDKMMFKPAEKRLLPEYIVSKTIGIHVPTPLTIIGKSL